MLSVSRSNQITLNMPSPCNQSQPWMNGFLISYPFCSFPLLPSSSSLLRFLRLPLVSFPSSQFLSLTFIHFILLSFLPLPLHLHLRPGRSSSFFYRRRR